MQPDSISIAKNMSAGYMPIAGIMISETIYDAMVAVSDKLGGFAHGFTYGAHPVACAVAVEALKIYEERNLIGHVRRVSEHFQNGLRRFAGHPLIGSVRGVGLIGGIEFAKDKRSRTPFERADAVGLFFANRAEENGLILRCIAGTDIIALAPPLVITEADVLYRRPRTAAVRDYPTTGSLRVLSRNCRRGWHATVRSAAAVELPEGVGTEHRPV
jgi:4-aminobutyrate--pyruvate transaminase